MMNDTISTSRSELLAECNAVRQLIDQRMLRESEEQIIRIMAKYPHSPEPHNLMGILLEKSGDHLAAMKHFRAACALDPTYLPARYNLEQYADMFLKIHKDAYTVEDCPLEPNKNLCKIEYDENGIGHIVKRNQAIHSNEK